MKRWKQLEKAVQGLLELHNLSYHRVDNYICYNCHTVQNANAAGFPDYFVYHPFLLAIECKTGSGRLSKKQKRVKSKLEETGVEYMVLRDNVDGLLEYLEGK